VGVDPNYVIDFFSQSHAPDLQNVQQVLVWHEHTAWQHCEESRPPADKLLIRPYEVGPGQHRWLKADRSPPRHRHSSLCKYGSCLQHTGTSHSHSAFIRLYSRTGIWLAG
jgi:hypothetical protein